MTNYGVILFGVVPALVVFKAPQRDQISYLNQLVSAENGNLHELLCGHYPDTLDAGTDPSIGHFDGPSIITELSALFEPLDLTFGGRHPAGGFQVLFVGDKIGVLSGEGAHLLARKAIPLLKPILPARKPQLAD